MYISQQKKSNEYKATKRLSFCSLKFSIYECYHVKSTCLVTVNTVKEYDENCGNSNLNEDMIVAVVIAI